MRATPAVALTRAGAPALAVDAPAEIAGDDVAAVAKQVGHEVYGVATPPGARLEVTRGSRGEVWVRYLSGGARAGDRRPAFLTVGTYRRTAHSPPRRRRRRARRRARAPSRAAA